jgi:3-oxoisoapionate kinase
VVLANAAWPPAGIGMIDVHDDATQAEAGKRMLEQQGQFVVGSSGVEYALMRAMKKSRSASFAPLGPVAQTIVVSGSVSPTTERQIRAALAKGFEPVAVSALGLAAGNADTMARAVANALHILSEGRSPLLFTALGAASDEGARLDAVANGRRNIGEGLGKILRAVLERTKLTRAIIAGGDSSSHALRQLDILALTTRFPLTATPGSPLCTAHADASAFNGLEIAMKGGQLGGDDYFVQLRDGMPSQ